MESLFTLESGFWADPILWGVPVWRLGAAVVLLFLGFVSRGVVRWFFEGLLKRRAEKTRLRWDDDLIAEIPRPLALVVQVLLWYLAAAMLTLPVAPLNVRLFVYQGMKVALAVAFVWVGFAFINVLALFLERASGNTETRLDDQAVPLARKTLKVIVAVVVGVMVVQEMGYSVTSLIASLGIGGLALALAAKDTVANFFGSIVVFTDTPFQIGDWVTVGDTEGIVEEVGFRTTRIRQFDKGLVTVPNQTFTAKSITNFSQRAMRRIKFSVGVSYETDPAQMRALLDAIRTLLREHPDIDQESIAVYFSGFGDSSLNILVLCWANTTAWDAFMGIQEDVFLRIMEAVEAMGLEIAFPTRTVYLREDRLLERYGGRRDG